MELERASHQPCTPKARQQPAFILLGELVFPDANDLPTAGAERAGDEPVAGLIAGDLLAPEAGILTRLGRVERASVPEAAVDEDG